MIEGGSEVWVLSDAKLCKILTWSPCRVARLGRDDGSEVSLSLSLCCRVCGIFLVCFFFLVFLYTISSQMDFWLLFHSLHYWLYVLLPVLMFLTVMKHIFPSEDSREQMFFLGVPLAALTKQSLGAGGAHWVGLSVRRVFCSHVSFLLGWILLLDWGIRLISSYLPSKNEMYVKCLVIGQ